MGSLGSEGANHWNVNFKPDALSQMSEAVFATACVILIGFALSEDGHSKSAKRQRESYLYGDPRLA